MNSFWDSVEYCNCDPIIQTSIDFKNDPAEMKANLCIGICCNDFEQLNFFESVKEAEKIVTEKYKAKPYMIDNTTDDYSKLTQELIFGKDSIYMKQNRICTIQSLGGAGALFLSFNILKLCEVKNVYVTDVPYVNHINMSNYWGYTEKHLRFFDSTKIGIDYEGFLEDLQQVLPNSAVFIQPCCYNPCSVEIEEEYHDKITDIVIEKKIIIVFDIPYQGFGSSDLDTDAKLIRKFQEKNIQFIVCQSFSKNMAMYGERVGAIHVVCQDKEECAKVARQCVLFTRKCYNFPPLHPNRVVVEILGNEQLRTKWKNELRDLSENIKLKRANFFDKLNATQKKYGLNINWEPYKKQSGLFCFIPLFANIYDALKKEHIYIVSNGRINMSSLAPNKLDFVVDRICHCLKEANIKA